VVLIPLLRTYHLFSRVPISSPVSQSSQGSPPANPQCSPMESAALMYAHSALNAAWIHLNAMPEVLPLSALQSPFLVSHSQCSLSLSPPPNQFVAPHHCHPKAHITPSLPHIHRVPSPQYHSCPGLFLNHGICKGGTIRWRWHERLWSLQG
jgi:hypothetical protein